MSARAGERDWDASSYERVSDPQVEWARVVLDRLPLEGHETVLDAGCGGGRVTQLLLDRLPNGHVVAVDSAPSMVETARASLGDRATVIQSDLVDLELDERVDAAFSNAVFHWIPDHDRLFSTLHAAMRPGARLVAQCGGEGNVARFIAIAKEVGRDPRFSEHFDGWRGPWNFAGPDETAVRLQRAGFDEIATWLESWPVRPAEPREFMRTVCLGDHLPRLPPELQDAFTDIVAERVGPELDYVRLNIEARCV